MTYSIRSLRTDQGVTDRLDVKRDESYGTDRFGQYLYQSPRFRSSSVSPAFRFYAPL